MELLLLFALMQDYGLSHPSIRQTLDQGCQTYGLGTGTGLSTNREQEGGESSKKILMKLAGWLAAGSHFL